MQKLTIRELLDTNRAALDGKGDLILLAMTPDVAEDKREDDPDHYPSHRPSLVYFPEVSSPIGCAIGVCMNAETRSNLDNDDDDALQCSRVNDLGEHLEVSDHDIPIIYFTQIFHDTWNDRGDVRDWTLASGESITKGMFNNLPGELQHVARQNLGRTADELMYRNWLNAVEEHLIRIGA